MTGFSHWSWPAKHSDSHCLDSSTSHAPFTCLTAKGFPRFLETDLFANLEEPLAQGQELLVVAFGHGERDGSVGVVDSPCCRDLGVMQQYAANPVAKKAVLFLVYTTL